MPAFEIKHRFTGAVLFTAELGAEYESKSGSVRLGAAIKLAAKAGAYLARANLARADLARAYLARAYLADANLAGADLVGAYLARAYLAGAYLADANLAGANLADANLADANLARANHIIPAGTPDGWTAYGWLREGYLSVRVGCREKRLDEARAYWTGKDNRREVMAALDYIEAIARLRGWAIEAPAESEAA